MTTENRPNENPPSRLANILSMSRCRPLALALLAAIAAGGCVVHPGVLLTAAQVPRAVAAEGQAALNQGGSLVVTAGEASDGSRSLEVGFGGLRVNLGDIDVDLDDLDDLDVDFDFGHKKKKDKKKSKYTKK